MVRKEEPPDTGHATKQPAILSTAIWRSPFLGGLRDEQAAYVASHMDQFDIAAKKGDIEREQTEYEDLP